VQFADPPALEANPWSWNNYTNNLFIESPAGVGFSYCDTAAGCAHDDNSTAQDNLAAVLSFFKAYPELQANKFWITGESYAGIYIPMLAYAIYQYNAGGGTPQVNLKGIAVGNGCIGHSAGHCGRDPTGLNALHDVEMIRGHGAMSRDVYNAIISNCSSNWAAPTPSCYSALDMVDIGDIDVYDFYNTCSDPAMTRRLRAPLGEDSLLARLLERRAQRAAALGLPPDPNCFSTTAPLQAYMNQASVKAALNVAADIDWAVCDNNGTFSYRRDYPDERTVIYPTLINEAKIEVLIYNGEADLCVPYTDNEYWTESMGYAATQSWAPWSVPGQVGNGPYVGGYSTRYDTGGANHFTFATVRGAGHMVPEVRPEPAYELLRSFITTGTV
jgi:carboxypeptidase C (cathepsin A)